MQRKSKFLLVACFKVNPIWTIIEHINAFCDFSQFEIKVLNVHAKPEGLCIPADVDINQFDGIIIHPTMTYMPSSFNSIDYHLDTKLANYPGLKILIKQDEHIHSHQTAKLIGDKKIDLVLSCVPKEDWPTVYPKHLVGDAEFMHSLTGYVSPFLRNVSGIDLKTRNIDISYRGSFQPIQCGRLGLEKWKIGQDVLSALKNTHLKLDISSNSKDVFHGKDWFEFLRSSKAVLGVESGSSLFDLDGEVERLCKAFANSHQDMDPHSEAYYLKAEELFLHRYVGNVKYNQISPRHFEAASAKAVQILYEGEYSHIFKANRHYLALKKDLSNLHEIIEKVKSHPFRKEMTECAFEEVIQNKQYHYETFIELFDKKAEELLSKKKKEGKLSIVNPESKLLWRTQEVLLMVPHELHLDPRIKWLEEGFSENIKVNVCGTCSDPEKPLYVFDPQKPNHLHINTYDMEKNILNIEFSSMDDNLMHWFNLFKGILNGQIVLPNYNSMYDEDSIGRHKWLCMYFLTRTQAFIMLFRKLVEIKGTIPSAIICNELHILLAGVVLSKEYDIPLIYDAHELFPAENILFQRWEIDFWTTLEKSLMPYVTLPVTVSKHLAEFMSLQYNKDFLNVPNCEPIKSMTFKVKGEANSKTLIDKDPQKTFFLFQGCYALGRGINQLINAWKHVNDGCILLLRGPEHAFSDQFKVLARDLDLLDKTVFFVEKVSESELVATAAQSDVGIIPYEPELTLNHQFCCPNKLSQYMAAGLPILSNNLDYVKSVIEDAGCGVAVDFNDLSNLVKAINGLAMDKQKRVEMGNKAKEYFIHHFNWEVVSEKFYDSIDKIISDKKISYPNGFNFVGLDSEKIPSKEVFLMTGNPQIILPSNHSVSRRLALFGYVCIQRILPNRVFYLLKKSLSPAFKTKLKRLMRIV